MKSIYSPIRVLGTAALGLLLATSCSDILDEQPRSSYDPTFFKTEKGVEGGITSMYSYLRDIYGQAYYYNSCLTGTDEATYGQSADGNFKDADLSGVGNLTSSTCRADALWGMAFTNINTCNGVIANGRRSGYIRIFDIRSAFLPCHVLFPAGSDFRWCALGLGLW